MQQANPSEPNEPVVAEDRELSQTEIINLAKQYGLPNPETATLEQVNKAILEAPPKPFVKHGDKMMAEINKIIK